jgi:hypothetical protein
VVFNSINPSNVSTDVVKPQVTPVTTGLWHCEIGLIRLEFSTTQHVHPKKFSSDLGLFCRIWGWICANEFSSTTQDLHNPSKLYTVLLLNRVQFWSFLTNLPFGPYLVRTNLRVFLGNLRNCCARLHFSILVLCAIST